MDDTDDVDDVDDVDDTDDVDDVEDVDQKAADVWKKDVRDFQAFSQALFEVRCTLGNEGKASRAPRLGLEVPDGLPDIRGHPS